MTEPMMVFDRRVVRQHRERAVPTWPEYNFLFAEVADRLAERLEDITLKFPRALELGCRGGDLAKVLNGRGGVETLIQTDLSHGFAKSVDGPAAVIDEEFLPFAEGSFDMVISNLSLHWVNDLPGALLQINKALRPDGLFVATMFGLESLSELRRSLADAELDIDGGVSPRVSPFTDVKDAGALLQRAGFNLPVVDADIIEVSYPNPLKLMNDLRRMGESNAVLERRKGLTKRSVIMDAARRYVEEYADEEGRMTATFQILYLTAWKPDPSQQKPLKPGASTKRLADALGVPEHVLSGDKKP